MLYYSPSQRGFYDDSIHARLPDDATAITREEHAALMAAQASGLMIGSDSDGAPVAAHRPGPTRDDALAELRRLRDERLRQSDYSQLPDAPLSAAQRLQWRRYRQSLRDITQNIDDPANIDWPTPPNHEA